jgi:hypothetical protein
MIPNRGDAADAFGAADVPKRDPTRTNPATRKERLITA